MTEHTYQNLCRLSPDERGDRLKRYPFVIKNRIVNRLSSVVSVDRAPDQGASSQFAESLCLQGTSLASSPACLSYYKDVNRCDQEAPGQGL